MNLLYTTDMNFLPQTAAGIVSVCENNRRERVIRFYVFCLNVPPSEQQKLSEMVKAYEIEGNRFSDDPPGRTGKKITGEAHKEVLRQVIFTDLEEIGQYFDFDVDTAGWNPIVLARLLPDRLLPEEVHRVIYLDGDTIVRRSLRPLWKTDMKGCAVGAAPEPTCSLRRKAALGLAGKPYCNAGVLLIDLDAWRKQETGRQILDYYRENGGHLFANDQDAINGSQKDSLYILSGTWNYHNTYDIYRYRLLRKNCDYPVPSGREVAAFRRNPHIVHFLGEERPWRAGCPHRFTGEYHRYLALTPWKDQPDEDGWQTYFFCWKIFNRVMRPFPLFRCYIINTLMPLMLRHRHR